METEQTSKGGGSFIGGFIVGGLIGATGAWLYGRRAQFPSADALRERGAVLRHQANELATRLGENLQEWNERSLPFIEKTQQFVAEAVNGSREFAGRSGAEIQRRFQTKRGEAATTEGPPTLRAVS